MDLIVGTPGLEPPTFRVPVMYPNHEALGYKPPKQALLGLQCIIGKYSMFPGGFKRIPDLGRHPIAIQCNSNWAHDAI